MTAAGLGKTSCVLYFRTKTRGFCDSKAPWTPPHSGSVWALEVCPHQQHICEEKPSSWRRLCVFERVLRCFLCLIPHERPCLLICFTFTHLYRLFPFTCVCECLLTSIWLKTSSLRLFGKYLPVCFYSKHNTLHLRQHVNDSNDACLDWNAFIIGMFSDLYLKTYLTIFSRKKHFIWLI